MIKTTSARTNGSNEGPTDPDGHTNRTQISTTENFERPNKSGFQPPTTTLEALDRENKGQHTRTKFKQINKQTSKTS